MEDSRNVKVDDSKERVENPIKIVENDKSKIKVVIDYDLNFADCKFNLNKFLGRRRNIQNKELQKQIGKILRVLLAKTFKVKHITLFGVVNLGFWSFKWRSCGFLEVRYFLPLTNPN